MLDACLMVHGSWLKAHGSWLMAKKGARPRSGPGPRAPFLAMSHEPWAMNHQACIKHQASSICFAICFVTNQHTTEVEALLTRQISIIFRRASFPNFEISRFPYYRFYKISLENLVFLYRRKKNQGVLGRPWTKRMVLRAISSTLKFKKSWKCWVWEVWYYQSGPKSLSINPCGIPEPPKPSKTMQNR